MSIRFCNALIASIVAMTLAAAPLQVEATMYIRVGDGICQPTSGEEYAHLATNHVASAAACSLACDNVNGQEENSHYRGFSHLKPRALRGNSIYDGNCICFFDCHHLPAVPAEFSSKWNRYSPAECSATGPVSNWDGSSVGGCYQKML